MYGVLVSKVRKSASSGKCPQNLSYSARLLLSLIDRMIVLVTPRLVWCAQNQKSMQSCAAILRDLLKRRTVHHHNQRSLMFKILRDSSKEGVLLCGMTSG